MSRDLTGLGLDLGLVGGLDCPRLPGNHVRESQLDQRQLGKLARLGVRQPGLIPCVVVAPYGLFIPKTYNAKSGKSSDRETSGGFPGG
jgi:hypothetical protein